jgi:predicted DNA-binding transcriptional regulator YafY
MNLINKVERLTKILDLLNEGNNLSIDELVHNLSEKKNMQNDFRNFIFLLYSIKTIYYDYISKGYKAKINFLSKTLFSSEELAIISILKNNSKYKSFENPSLKSCKKIEIAIKNEKMIKCKYYGKNVEIYPLKTIIYKDILYLIVIDKLDSKIKIIYLNHLKNMEISYKNNFNFTKRKIYHNVIKADHRFDIRKLEIQLFVDGEVSKYFLNNPLNDTQKVVRNCEDQSIILKIIIANFKEIIPFIQKYILFIKIISISEEKI